MSGGKGRASKYKVDLLLVCAVVWCAGAPDSMLCFCVLDGLVPFAPDSEHSLVPFAQGSMLPFLAMRSVFIQVCVEFEADVNGERIVQKVALKPENLEKTTSPDAGCSMGPDTGKAASSKLNTPAHDFLALDRDAEIVSDWPKHLCSDDVDIKKQRVKESLGFVLKCVEDQTPVLTQDDVLVVRRNKVLEVWTNRDFAKGTLILAPTTTEYKDRYFTVGRSALVQQEDILKQGRHLVLDGRLRSQIAELRSFSLFWIVQRGEDLKECNMCQQYAKVQLQVSIDLGTTPKRSVDQVYDADVLPQVPVMVNPKARGMLFVACFGAFCTEMFALS